MTSRFRVLLTTICVRPEKVDGIVLACCAMHNMLKTIGPTTYGRQQTGQEIGTVNATIPSAKVGSRRSSTQTAKYYREYLCTYVNSIEGRVSWQDSIL
jgi:hypothetical protein